MDANLTDADLKAASLTGANLWDANLTKADLRAVNLTDALLGDANLGKAFLRNANLTDADLGGANLTDADLGGANLTGANLWDANLTKADLGGAIFNEKTVLPDAEMQNDDYENPIFDKYWTPDTDMTRYTNLEHPDFWQPHWTKKQDN